MKQNRKLIKISSALLISFILILSLCSPSLTMASNEMFSNQNTNQKLVASISTQDKLTQMINDTVNYYKANNTKLSSWQGMVALWGAGENLTDGSWQLPEWKTEDPGLKEDANGTDHVRYIFGLLAMGEDPSNAWEKERNLYAELAAQQKENGSIGGINKHLYAMLALHTGEMLEHDEGTWNKEKEQKALDFLLSQEIVGGGFALSGTHPDTDVTGMALLTLGIYQGQSAVDDAIERAKAVLMKKQLDNAGFISDGSWGSGDNLNSLAASVSGLVAIGEDVTSDNWTKNGNKVVDTYERFQLDDGSFKWKETDQKRNLAATEQALISLLDIQTGKSVWHKMEEIELPDKVANPSIFNLSIDGTERNIYTQQAIEFEKGQTALKVLTQALDEANIGYVIEDTEWGPYLKSIDEQEAGSLGGWDGWMFKVNGLAPDVGAGDYLVKDGDELQFYYSRWAAISSDSDFPSDALNPVVTVSLVGDTFTEEAVNLENWKITAGTTGLHLNSIEKVNNQEVRLQFEGTAKSGTISVQALTGALLGEAPSNEINIQSPIDIIVSVDGINASVLPQQDLKVVQAKTALEVLTHALDQAGIKYVIEETSWGPYLKSIDEQEAGSLGGWDGWMFKVNGLAPDVGANDYVVKDGDKIQFYYNRWATISSQSDIISDTQNPTVSVSLMGDTFAEDATNIDNWMITSGTTGLKLKQIEKVNNQEVKLQFEGTAKRGTISVQVLPGAIKAEYPSEPVSIKVIQVPGSGSGGSPSKNKTASLSVEKRSIGKGDIISTTSVKIEDGDTAYSILERLAKEKEISLKTTGSGKTLYIQAIDGLEEYDHGPLSGWMYSVNGKFLSDSVGEYRVKDGDRIRFQYTTNLGEDIGNDYNPDKEEDKGQASSSGGSGGSGESGNIENNDTVSVEQAVIQKHLDSSAKWILKTGDFSIQEDFQDWNVLALERAGKEVPTNYYGAIESYVKKNNGYFRLVTDYERIALTVLAVGKDPTNVAGYNLIEKIYQNDRITNQGTNGAIYALLTLDSKNYKVPDGALWTREKLLSWILEQQNPDGGFPLSKSGSSDVDITAMTLQALAKYQDQERVQEAVEKALTWLSKQQLDNGGFKVLDEENSESISQVIIALSSLGIDPMNQRFVKNNGDLLTALLTFVNEDGGLAHLRNDSSNYMATQQGLMAFAAYDRYINQKNNLYDMNDVKEQDNKILFSDVTNKTFAQEEIYRLAEAGIINGYPDGTFKPNQNINRGQAANLFMRALKLEIPVSSNSFGDILPSSPFSDAAKATKAAGIFKGSNNGTTFGPLDVLTREHMASVLVRAFNLQPKDVHVNLTDLERVSKSHRRDVEILFQNSITTGRANGEFDPKAPVTRVQFVVFLSRAMALNTNE